MSLDVVAGPPIGPREPRRDTPVRRAGSVRRTTTIDSLQAAEHVLEVDARGRDLRTTDAGAEVVAEAAVRLVLEGRGRTVAAIESDPPAPELTGLIGTSAMFGFRKALAALPGHVAPHGTLLHLLLDDLTGAALVAGYGEVQSGAMVPGDTDPEVRARLALQRDLCAGWAADGGMMRSAEAHGVVPMPPEAVAPDLERDDDPIALHAVAPLPDHAMRRRRRLDLVLDEDGQARFDVHFRDTHAERAEQEGIVHEYSLTGTVADGVVTAVAAVAHVLPWLECPQALGSADRVVGRALDEVRDLVRAEFRGTSTCTHLNDALRSLGDLSWLRATLG